MHFEGIIPDGTRPYLCKSTVVDARANPVRIVVSCGISASVACFFFFWKGFFGKVLIWWSKFRYRDLFTNFDWLVVYLVFFSSWGKKNFYIGINKVGYFEEDIVIALCVLWYLFNLWRKTWNFIILPLKKNLLSNWSEYSRSLLLLEIRGEKMKSLNYGCFLSK